MTAGVGMTRHDICIRQYLTMPHLLSPMIILNYRFLEHAEETKSCYSPLVLLITTHFHVPGAILEDISAPQIQCR